MRSQFRILHTQHAFTAKRTLAVREGAHSSQLIPQRDPGLGSGPCPF